MTFKYRKNESEYVRGEGGEEKEELGERVVLGKRGGDKRG